ncbi:MAG TPA: FkbM family methyltransferase [Verrucomicrobiae bacterium]|jgi:FkbM family methyltransferase|nr:FkbM family methyltransferase [Verrucomicrobiae bacterium]
MQTESLFQKTLVYHLFQEFQTLYRFKYVLPKITEVALEGLKLDVSGLSSKIRNRLLSGAYEAHEKRMCFDFLNQNDSVLEIGGAIGFIGLICQKKLGIKNYATFEANPKTYQILKRNYELNGLEPRVWNMALAHADGYVDLEVGSDFWENSICYNNAAQSGVKTVRVPAGTLQTLLQLAGQKINVLIIDIEGAEQFLDLSQVPEEVSKIIIELHPKVMGQEVTYNIVASLIGLGFRVAREEEDTFVFLRK